MFGRGPERTKQNSIHLETAVLVLVALFVLTVGADSVGYAIPFAQPILAFLLLTFAPGMLVLTLMGLAPRLEVQWLLYSVGTSLIVIMFSALSISMLPLLVEFDQPLSFVSSIVMVLVLTVGLCTAVRFTAHDRSAVSIPVITLSPVSLTFVLLPLLAVLSTEYLNRTGSNLPLLVVLVLLAIVPLALIVSDVSERWYPLALLSVALALLYHKTIWDRYYFRGHATAALVWRFHRWAPSADIASAGIWPSSSVLPNALLYPIYAQLGGIDITTELQLVNPLLVSVVPLVMYVTFRRYVSAHEALLGSFLMIFAHPFYIQFVVVGRAAPPVLFLTLLVMAVTDRRLSEMNRAILSLLFVIGNIVSHYGSAYFIMFALVGTILILKSYTYLNDWVGRAQRWYSKSRVDRMFPMEPSNERDRSTFDRLGSLTWSLVGFYITLTLAWYIFIQDGAHFDDLPRRLAEIAAEFTQPTGGGTAARVTRDYSSQSIQFAKYLYAAIALLLVIGISVAYLRKFFASETVTYSDEYLALTTAVFGAFSSSILFSRAWGGGRPLMLVFAISSVFAAIGICEVGRATGRVSEFATNWWSRFTARHDIDVPYARKTPSWSFPSSVQLLAVFLAALLVFNTGVVDAVVLGGYAPSNVPLDDRVGDIDDPDVFHVIYRETDVQTLAWYVDHGNTSQQAYGDRLTTVQHNQWYASELAKIVKPSAIGATKRKKDLKDLEKPGIEEGYVILQGHNVGKNIDVYTGLRWRPISEVDMQRPQRNKIYTTGNSTIYYNE